MKMRLLITGLALVGVLSSTGCLESEYSVVSRRLEQIESEYRVGDLGRANSMAKELRHDVFGATARNYADGGIGVMSDGQRVDMTNRLGRLEQQYSLKPKLK